MSDSEYLSDFDENKQIQLVRDFEAEGKLILNELLPKKSFERYEAAYNDFMEWSKNNRLSLIDENILLVYFSEMSKNIKPSTIWARWSMLRLTLLHRRNVDISAYQKLKSFLKNFSKGYKPKQSKTFSGSEIAKFLESADDYHYLATKIILIIGMCGAARCCELVNLKITDVEDLSNYFSIHIRDSKHDYPRKFVICTPYYEAVKKYFELRPSDMDTNRFFVCYSKGKCTRQVIGKHKISEVPKVVALYLNLEDVDLYTGHSMRRTSATLLSDSGASLVRIKNLGAWRSDAVAQKYIDNSIVTKQQNFDGILSSVNSSSAGKLVPKKTSTVTSSTVHNELLGVSRSVTEKNVFEDTTSNSKVPFQMNSSSAYKLVPKKTCTATSSSVSNDLLDGSRSLLEENESEDTTLYPKVPFQRIDNTEKLQFKKAPNVVHSEESSSHIESDENFHSSNKKSKKRKLEKLIMDKEDDEIEQRYPINFYNCENITMNFNKYSCSHDSCVGIEKN